MSKPKDKPKTLSVASIRNTLKCVTRQTAQTNSTSSNALPMVTARVTEIPLGTTHVTTITVTL